MADRSGEGDSIAEPVVAGTLEEAGESFGEETGWKVGGGGQEGDIDGVFGRVVGHGGGEVAAVVESRVLVDCEAENAISNGVADILPRDGVGDGDGQLEDAREHSGLVEMDEKWGDDRKVEEGECVLEGMLWVGSGTVNDVVGGELKFNEEKGGVVMVANQKELVKDGKGSHGDRTGIAASNAVGDHISNADIASENIELSMEKEIAGVPGDGDHGMNDVTVVKNVEAKETSCLDRNVNNLGEENLENIEKVFAEMDGDELGVAASDAIEKHKSNVEFACGNVENGVSITIAATLEGGVTAVDGGAVICERSVSGITEADQLVNGQEHHANDPVADEITFNPGESETKIEIQSTCNVDVQIDWKANEMYSDPSNGGVEAMENRQPCSKEKDITDLGCAVPNSANMVADEASAPNDDGLGDDDAMEVDEQLDGAEDLEMTDEIEESEGELKTESSRGVDEAVYLLPPDPENMFAVSNLVWGKVRSHPWWPGQIFDQSDASEKAMKYHKKDSILVAYFGDHTFAWNEASLLKPFRSYFSNAVKQSNSEGFQNAMDCALEEVSRRVELGLACSCLSKDVLDEIKVQVVENAGIQPDLCTREGVDKSADANSFKPKECLQYLKRLALSPSSGADRLELVIAKAQLLAISLHKGFNQLPEFQSFGDLVEDDAEALDSKDNTQVGDAVDANAMAASGKKSVDIPKGSAHRKKHNLKDIVYHRRKERSLFELMDEAMMYSEDDEFELDGTLLAKRHRGLKTNDDSGVPHGRKSISTGKVVSPLPKPSFKIGACISRVASQMTRSPSLKTQNEEVGHVEGAAVNDDAEKVKTGVAAEDRSLEDLLSQLQSAAISPMGGNSFLNVITCFFSDFRNSIAVGIDLNVGRIGGKRKKSSQHAGRSSEAFEFEDMNYSYWTDRIIGNGFEDNPAEVVNGENQFCYSEQEKPRRAGRRSYTRRRDVEVGDPLPEKPVGYVDPNSPAELVLTFPEPKFIPSEVSLNNTFKRFGTLNELQTEMDRDGNRARVVFKKCSDAEVACSSASKFNIFGSLAVNYQLNYTLSEPFTTYYKPVPLPEGPEEAN